MLRLNKRFYNADDVKSAADDFEDICTIDVREDDNIFITITPKSPEQDISRLEQEFANHVLMLMKDSGRV